EKYAIGFDAPFERTEDRAPCARQYPLKKAYFGDLHIHTALSVDAYPDGTRTFPPDAYRFAQGEPIDFPVPDGGEPFQVALERPIDFAAVTDHAGSLGAGYICRQEGAFPGYATKSCETFRAGGEMGVRVFSISGALAKPRRNREVCGEKDADCLEALRIVWQEVIDAAEAAYDKSSSCQFTSFVGYEYTRSLNSMHLHRNTIFRNASVPERPGNAIDQPRTEDLLAKLETECRLGIDACDAISIPHNSNISGGNAFNPDTTLGFSEESRNAYRQMRQSFDRLVEITQHKGASECINGMTDILGDTDEYCDIEALRQLGKPAKAINMTGYLPRIDNVNTRECAEKDLDPTDNLYKGFCLSSRDYVRGALLEGMREESQYSINPFEFGIIGSTDTHISAAGYTDEASWSGHIAYETKLDGRLGNAALGRFNRREASPGGLAGVWAVENSRDALFHSMKRRETFGTSGARIAPRFFAGRYKTDLCSDENWLNKAYSQGVPMGAKLIGDQGSIRFLAQAERDRHESANPLQTLQIIKGWIDDQGDKRFKVIDVAEAPTDEGAETLCAVYDDPHFDPSTRAYYYMRVVETPTQRWSTAQCEALDPGTRPPGCTMESPEIINELAWTSPIWFSPE
ncbi:MAG: DUF3604 domain-containing protein, partial [Pseudomonadota bacterium]